MCAPCARQRPVADECVEGAVRRRSPLSGPHGLGPLWNRASGITTSPPCLLLFSILHSSLAHLRVVPFFLFSLLFLASTLSSLYHFIFVQTLCSPTFAGRFGDSCKPKQEDSKYPIPSNTTQLSVRQLHFFKSTHFFHLTIPSASVCLLPKYRADVPSHRCDPHSCLVLFWLFRAKQRRDSLDCRYCAERLCYHRHLRHERVLSWQGWRR